MTHCRHNDETLPPLPAYSELDPHLEPVHVPSSKPARVRAPPKMAAPQEVKSGKTSVVSRNWATPRLMMVKGEEEWNWAGKSACCGFRILCCLINTAEIIKFCAWMIHVFDIVMFTVTLFKNPSIFFHSLCYMWPWEWIPVNYCMDHSWIQKLAHLINYSNKRSNEISPGRFMFNHWLLHYL